MGTKKITNHYAYNGTKDHLGMQMSFTLEGYGMIAK
jgi:hypothetical protein